MAKTPLFTVFRAFHVFLKMQKPCKYHHFLRSTRQICCNLQCFFSLLAKTLVFAVFYASRVQKVLVFTAFSAFLHGSRKRRYNAKMLQFTAFCDFRKAENRPKNVSKRHFFPILGTLKTEGGGMLLETLVSDPDSGQKALPHPPEGFLVFFGARRRRVGGLGRPYHRALVALGRS